MKNLLIIAFVLLHIGAFFIAKEIGSDINRIQIIKKIGV